jgi:hypothetical protein
MPGVLFMYIYWLIVMLDLKSKFLNLNYLFISGKHQANRGTKI